MNSILIPIFNKKNFTKACLDYLLHLDKDKNEIIIIDNASTDGTHELLKEYEKISNFLIIKNEKNLGFGKALNKAYEASKGHFILFLNNDIKILDNLKNWISDFVIQCKENCIISPTAGFVDPKSNFSFKYHVDKNDKRVYNYLSGWCIGSFRTNFDKLILEANEFKGPWDESFFAYFEDTDLSFRAKRLGMNLEIVDVPIQHYENITSRQLNTRALYFKSQEIFLRKWEKNGLY